MAGSIWEVWKVQIEKTANGSGTLNVKQLASIINVSISKIYKDIESRRLEVVKLGPEGSRCEIRIGVEKALEYISSFLLE